jgi:cytochrome c553
MKTKLIIFISTLFVLSCNNTKKEIVYISTNSMEAEGTHPGKKLMETNCYVCHNPTADHDNRVGPPMIAVKKHYLTEGVTKQEFISAIQEWIKNPNEENAKMHGAVRRFGVMPKQVFPEETIQQIADYMYDNDIDEPEWFEAHFNSEKGKHNGMGKGNGKGRGMHKKQTQTDVKDLPYNERGLQYALSTKAVLGQNLMGTIQKKGTVAALEFCNTKAYPLTDSMAVVHNANIKRVTDKPRNPYNLADSDELKHIEFFKQQIGENIEIEPIVTEREDKIQVYYPIVTNDMCLQCHGTPNENITKETLNKLTQLYPDDKAFGYNINEVRGMWSISFDK